MEAILRTLGLRKDRRNQEETTDQTSGIERNRGRRASSLVKTSRSQAKKASSRDRTISLDRDGNRGTDQEKVEQNVKKTKIPLKLCTLTLLILWNVAWASSCLALILFIRALCFEYDVRKLAKGLGGWLREPTESSFLKLIESISPSSAINQGYHVKFKLVLVDAENEYSSTPLFTSTLPLLLRSPTTLFWLLLGTISLTCFFSYLYDCFLTITNVVNESIPDETH
jgi:hypothetical protein